MIIEGGERGDLLNKRVYTHVIKYKRWIFFFCRHVGGYKIPVTILHCYFQLTNCLFQII
jgi:hypothetical protein